MKDIKSFLIGFLSCVCLMLFMGQTKQPSNNIGRYQAFGVTNKNVGRTYMIDTHTGQMWKKKNNHWEDFILPNDFRDKE